jgi:simple sugar transport system permease protein
MTAISASLGPASPDADDRLHRSGRLRQVLSRPELGSVAGAIAVFVFFSVVSGDRGFLSLDGTANYLDTAAELGILAVPVALLMVSGEFDLSISSVVGASSITVALLTVQYNQPLWLAILVAVALAVAIGLLNAVIVIHTRLPSFIVTLATQFIVRGVTIGLASYITGRTEIGGVDAARGFPGFHKVFGSNYHNFQVSIIWWLALAAVATWVLLGTRFGNWTFGAGGSMDAARNVGVPVAKVKATLFVSTALAGCLVGVIQTISFAGADVLRGTNSEFEAIIAVVIGGTLLTGGYGSAVGAVFGALIFGMVQQGIVFTGVNADWYLAFLGLMLITAVLVNNYIRHKAAEDR